MPSKGNRILKFRLPTDLEDAILRCIAHRNLFSPEEAWSVSDFLRIAAREKLAKMKRSAGKRGSARRGPGTQDRLDTPARIALPTDANGGNDDA